MNAILGVIAQMAQEVGDIIPLLITACLMALLVGRELLSGLNDTRIRRLNQVLAVVSVPLFLIFATTVGVRIAEMIGNQR